MIENKSIKGGKDSDLDQLYEKVGNVSGALGSFQKSLDSISESLVRLWNKFDENQRNLTKMAKEISDEHSASCPAKAELKRFALEKEKNVTNFRWLVTTMLAIIALGIAYLALKK